MLKYCFVLIGGVAFAGQSIQLSNATVGSASIPAFAVGSNSRVEFAIHDWNPAVSGGSIIGGAGNGINVAITNNAGTLGLVMYRSSAGGGGYSTCNFNLPMGTPFLYVRYQNDFTGALGGAAKTDYCQAWDINGVLINNTQSSYLTQSANSNGVVLASSNPTQNISIAFFRVYTSLVSTTGTLPTTAQSLTNCVVSWKFDGTLNDSCAAGPYNAAMSTGSPVYVTSPAQDRVVPILKSSNVLLWGTGSLRAGFPAQLDGSASFSQADGSANVSCLWQMLSGPSQLVWDDHASCTPVVRGLIFGDYNFQLAVTDLNGVRAIATQHIGAVATDTNGVVINADPSVDLLFGPMIAFGKNPWGYQDWWAMHASQLRLVDYTNPDPGVVGYPHPWIQGPLSKPQWEYTGSGTVAWPLNCNGSQSAFACGDTSFTGTVSGSTCTVGATSCTISTLTGLDLSAFPTHVIFTNGGASNAEVRVCSNTGTTLNFCYDGWGQSVAHTFTIGNWVLQSKVKGTGTHFITDATAAVCPVGVPGPPGPSLYSTGTIALTAGSTTMTGSGTAWTSAMIGNWVRVPATHSSAAFTFVAQITAASGTSITLSRVFPATADTAGGLAYNIMLGQRTMVLFYTHPLTGSGTGELMFGNSDCESETEAYINPYGAYSTLASSHGISLTTVSGMPYSVTDSTGWVNQASIGGINFYGEDLAHRALYYRSGLAAPLTAANYISDYWIKSPWGNADGNGFPRLFLGGGGIGAFMAKILTNRGSWDDLRGYANIGRQMMVDRIGDCNGGDSREVGYSYTFVILAAIYDSDTTSTNAPGGIPWRTYWQNQLVQMKINDTACQSQVHTGAAVNSFANGLYFNINSQLLTMTNGSAAVTGTGIPSNLCQGTASGTAIATNGSNTLTVVTGTFPTGTDNTSVFLTGISGGLPFVQNIEYSGSGAASSPITLGAFWKGDSGTISWMTQDLSGVGPNLTGAYMTTIAESNADVANLQKNWACVWNSASSITLNRAWDSPSSGGSHAYHMWVSNLAGFGQQAFMLGIKTYGTILLASQTVPVLAAYKAPYRTFTSQSADWVWNFGMDQQLFSTNYGRVFQITEPTNTIPSGSTYQWKTPGSTYGGNTNLLASAREQNAETSATHGLYYLNNPTTPNRVLGDELYGAVWGYCPWATAGVYCDQFSTAGNPNASNLLDLYIHSGKWTGFFTGIGMTHQWPAARVGGAQPARPRTIFVSVRVGDVPSTASISVIVTAPSSAQTTFNCPTEPCAITVDDRQGAHWYQIQYLSSSGSILAQSQGDLLPSN